MRTLNDLCKHIVSYAMADNRGSGSCRECAEDAGILFRALTIAVGWRSDPRFYDLIPVFDHQTGTVKFREGEVMERAIRLAQEESQLVGDRPLGVVGDRVDYFPSGPEVPKSPTVRDMVRDWLLTHGYDGLAGDDCGCLLSDLMPCDDPVGCVPGHKVTCRDDCTDCPIGGENKGLWCVKSGRPPLGIETPPVVPETITGKLA